MYKKSKCQTAGRNEAEGVKSGSEDRIWELYLQRVGQVDLIHTVRRDSRVIFREAFNEAKVALGVFEEECIKEV